MANSGNFKTPINYGSPTSNFNTRNCYFNFYWQVIGQDYTNNTSTIKWWVTRDGDTYIVYNIKVNFNGSTSGWGYPQDSDYYGRYQGSPSGVTVFGPYTTTITHNNDGTKSVDVTVSGNIASAYDNCWYNSHGNYNAVGTSSIVLDRIPKDPPTINSVTVSNTEYINHYVVAGYSNSTVTINATAHNSASISNYLIKYGSTILYNGSSNTSSFKVPTISSTSQDITYSITVTDSYGQSTTTTASSFTALKYTKGKFTTSPISQRCDSNGELNEQGEYAHCTISGECSKIGNNNIQTTITVTVGGNSNNISQNTNPINLNVTVGSAQKPLLEANSYEVIYTLSDLFGSVQNKDIISVSFHTGSVEPHGKGVAFGKKATQGYFDVDNMIPRFGSGRQEFNTDNNGQLIIRDMRTNSTNGSMFTGWGEGHRNHGLYSYGYAPTTTTWTTDPLWMIYRDQNGDVIVNGKADSATSATTASTVTMGVTTETATLTRNDNIDSGHKDTYMVDYWNFNIKKYGHVVILELILKGDGQWHQTGYNLFSGTLSAFRPVTTVVGSGYYGNAVFTGNFYTNGNIIVRVSGYSNGFTYASNDNLYMSWTYLTDD